MIFIKILQIISGNDNGGGANHVINICKNNIDDMKCEIACIGQGPLYDKAINLNIPVVSFSLKEMVNGTLSKFIEKNQIDIVNFHGAKSNFIYLLIKNNIKIPAVVTIHSDYRYDFLNDKIKKVLYTPLSEMGLKRFNNYICVSNYLKDLLNEKKFEGKKYVIPNGIDIEDYRPNISSEKIRKKYKILKDDFVYIMVARMHPIKNHNNLINAFSRLNKEYKDTKLFLLGEGELIEELINKVQKLNIEDKVVFAGFVNPTLDYFNASDISILTSFNEGGAPPLVILESAITKNTVISSNVGDMSSIINKDNGFLIDPYSEDDIYDKMKKAYLMKDKLDIMGNSLYNHIIDKYSIENFWDNYYNTYKHILTGVN
ncbi:MAG: glycosyltransferase family 4 protein [Clostridiaceae bacterium]